MRTVFKGVFKFLMGVSWLALCVPAFSARAPDAVERKITLTGQAALSFGGLFGFAATAPSSDSLRLGRGTEWAVYLLKQDTPTQLWNDNEGSPARYDVVTFSPGQIPSITISPYWLDMATALPNTENGAYELESPFVRDELPGSDSWTLLIKRLKANPGWSNAGGTPFDRCYTAPDRVELCMTVLRKDDYPANKRVSGYVVVIKAQVPDHQPTAAADGYKIDETPLGPQDSKGLFPTVSRDGDHFAYVRELGRKACVVVDGRAGTQYDGIGVRSLAFSPDGEHLAYQAAIGGKALVVLDGQAGPLYDGIGSPPSFSPDGKRMAYKAGIGAKQFVVVDGQAGAQYDGIGATSPVFSPDGKRVAYNAQIGEKWSVVVDGRAGASYEGIGEEPIFSPNSMRVAYGALKAGKWLLVVDGHESAELAEIGKGDVCFSPDSKRIAYAASNGKRWRVVVNGKGGVEYDGVARSSLAFSRDSTRMAYVVMKGARRVVVVDGQESADYDDVQEGSLVFSPDAKHVAYAAVRGAKRFLVVDGKAGADYDRIGLPIFSPDGKRLAYRAEKGEKQVVVVDAKEGTEHNGVRKVLFSPDSKRVAYEAQGDRNGFVVVDGHALEPFDYVIANGPTFHPDGVLEFLAVRNHTLYRVTSVPAP